MSNICPSCLHENSPGDRTCIVCGTALNPTTTVNSSSASAPATSGLHLPPGTLLKQGQYQIQSLLGQGGFGITYQGIYCANSAPVAIKELWPESGYRSGLSVLWPSSIPPAEQRKQIEKFKIEAAYLQRCNSPHIAKVYDCFEENSTIYMVMEFIDGAPLSKYLENQGRLAENEVIDYMKQIAHALSIVHQNQLLHRDIKPENIMIDRNDRAVLIDFGTAREFMAGKTSDHTVFLSPGYAPFEQYSSNAKRFPATDIYALCASMYELLTGQLPSGSADRATTLHGGGPDPLVPPRQLNPNISAHLEQTILMGMRFRVEERIPSAQDLIQALEGKLVSPSHQTAKDFVSRGELEQAVSKYEICVQQEPNNGEAAVELALVLVYLDGDRAEAAAQHAIQVQPQDGRSYGVCGLVNCRRQQWHNAVQQLQQGLALSPREAWMHTNLAWALGQLGNWESADQAIQKSLQLDSHSTFALSVQAWVCFHRQQWKLVVRAASQAIHKSQNDQSQMGLALKSCVYPLIIAALDKVTTQKGSDIHRRVQSFVTEVPNNGMALGLKAWSEYRSGSLAAARQSFDLASRCHPIPNWVARDRGLICEHLNDLNAATQWYEMYCQHDRQDTWSSYRLGTVLGKLGQWQRAKQVLEEALQQDPSLASAHSNLGWVLLNLRTPDGKVEWVKELLAAYRQALVLYETQDRSKAQEVRAMFAAIDMSL